MAGDDEAFWELEIGAEEAAVEVEHPVAVEAVEVVVVLEAGAFVARGLSGELDGAEDVGVDEVLESAVDGGHAEVRDAGTGLFPDLAGAEGAA